MSKNRTHAPETTTPATAQPKRRPSPTEQAITRLQAQRENVATAYRVALEKATKRVNETYKVRLLEIDASLEALKGAQAAIDGDGDDGQDGDE